MTTYYLDIETIPHDAQPHGPIPDRAFEATWQEPPEMPTPRPIASNLRDPGRISLAKEQREHEHREAMAAWHRDRATDREAHGARALEWWSKESLDPIGSGGHVGGRICCLALAKDDDAPECWAGDEDLTILPALAAALWAFVPGRDVIVGHNIRGFDAPFIASRCLVLNVARAAWYALRRRGKWGPHDSIVDTLEMIPQLVYGGRPTNTGRLTDWADALGLAAPGQPGDGSEVLGWYRAGDLATIRAHCIADVEEVRRLYRLLVDGPLPIEEQP